MKNFSILLTSFVALSIIASCGAVNSILKDVASPITGELSISSPVRKVQ